MEADETGRMTRAISLLAGCIVSGVEAKDQHAADRIVRNIENKLFELQDVETASSDTEQELLKAAWSEITGKPRSQLLRNPIV